MIVSIAVGDSLGALHDRHIWYIAPPNVSIAVGDSLGALPITDQLERNAEPFQSQWAILWGRYGATLTALRSSGRFQSQWAILWGRYLDMQVLGLTLAVSIAVGDSLGALRGTLTFTWEFPEVSIAVGDSLGALLAYPILARDFFVFQSQWAILWGRYTGRRWRRRGASMVSIAVGDSLGALLLFSFSLS